MVRKAFSRDIKGLLDVDKELVGVKRGPLAGPHPGLGPPPRARSAGPPTTSTSDLVFYNRLLRCFVLIDLKLGKLAHQDLGQLALVSGMDADEVAGVLDLLRRHDVTVEEDGRVRYASELLRRWVAARQAGAAE